jgi:alkylation response protein AidB-like acyl-CoA dehydrogenase
MEFDLSADQRALQQAARELLDASATSEEVRKAIATDAGYDAGLWAQMVEQGWPAIAVAVEHGGVGLGEVELAVLAEQVGRHVAPVPFLSTALALHALAASDADDAAALSERLLAGGIGALAAGDGPVVDAPIADVLVVLGDDEVTAHDISAARPPAQPWLDLTRPSARVDVGVLADPAPLGGPELAASTRNCAAVLVSAELLGLAGAMLDVSVQYAKVREQFGRPIGSFQAVKHRLADAYVDVEGMRSSAYYAAWAVQTGAPDADLAASIAKSWCGDAGRRVLASALQVHGGIGFTAEHDLHLYLKRAEVDARLYGDPAWHRARIVALLRARIAAGESAF